MAVSFFFTSLSIKFFALFLEIEIFHKQFFASRCVRNSLVPYSRNRSSVKLSGKALLNVCGTVGVCVYSAFCTVVKIDCVSFLFLELCPIVTMTCVIHTI